MNIATNGPADLLPAAQYNVFLWSYSCHSKNCFTEGVPLESLTVEAAQKVTKVFSFDVRVINPTRSAENPKGNPATVGQCVNLT